jgi:2-polyprenyl-3-methyl-5-hydroxy-6-metoxy-1,4-benzoquinol methylase
MDIGYGRGENVIMLAMNGCDITGIYLVKDTISYAKAKTLERHIEVNFVAGNVLKMYRLFMEGEFDIVIGPGLFHG